ncbi:hypothetical protein MSTO_24230 [Mycobacterium stomatepiae]|uniref:Uncharacterized protein n=1 Tax=Mycobacterium stomatepiae TaxID=470076 RepID=A0A7I7Q7B0_9MYCO|nr:hypothetical protein MSTO_24230 [Mycobacterium stomatepiae]
MRIRLRMILPASDGLALSPSLIRSNRAACRPPSCIVFSRLLWLSLAHAGQPPRSDDYPAVTPQVDETSTADDAVQRRVDAFLLALPGTATALAALWRRTMGVRCVAAGLLLIAVSLVPVCGFVALLSLNY